MNSRFRRGATGARPATATAVAVLGLALGLAGPAAAAPAHTAGLGRVEAPGPAIGWEAAASGMVRTGQHDPGRKILVSLERRRLWLVVDGDTVMSAPVAIGKGGAFTFDDRTYEFQTPRGQRQVLEKRTDPSWVPPDWHYYEKAVYRDLTPVHLADGDTVTLSDSTYIEVRGKEVGRVNRWGNWWPFTPGSEIIFDGKIFIPPLGSPQRVIPNALGPVKLSLGDGYLIHGTHRYNEESIGDAASHGCIRMRNADVVRLSELVDVGTPVVIF